MKRSKLFFLSIILMFVALSIPFQSVDTSADVFTSARAMCVIESSSNRILYAKNENEKRAMASTTKIMTAITAIESGMDLDTPFEISRKAIGISGTSIYLKDGEQLTLRDLLYGLMLVSGNDASFAIGEYVGNGIEHFIDMMNWKAHQIGAFNTHFENTHGLDADGHYTSAYDLAIISSYALKNEIFKEIVSTKDIQITNTDGKIRYFRNKNKLLNALDGAIGVKTGYTGDAGRCLVSAVEREGMQVVCVVLDCRPMFEDSAEMLEKAFKEYDLIDLAANIVYPESLRVENGSKDSVLLSRITSCYYPLKEGEKEKISIELNIADKIDAPIKKGDEIGEIRIFIDKDLLFSKKIFTMEDVKEKGVLQKIGDVISQWWFFNEIK